MDKFSMLLFEPFFALYAPINVNPVGGGGGRSAGKGWGLSDGDSCSFKTPGWNTCCSWITRKIWYKTIRIWSLKRNMRRQRWWITRCGKYICKLSRYLAKRNGRWSWRSPWDWTLKRRRSPRAWHILKSKKISRRSTVCMHLLMRQNKGKIKLSNNACPDWLIVYLQSWPKGFGTPPFFTCISMEFTANLRYTLINTNVFLNKYSRARDSWKATFHLIFFVI